MFFFLLLQKIFCLLCFCTLVLVSAFKPTALIPRVSRISLKMVTITEGVEFDTVAREWRMKWSPENDKKSLAEVQKVLNKYIADIKAVNGVANVQRVVCGGCMDFKVITSLPADKFALWEGVGFAPEERFLSDVKSVDGVTTVETQTYTLMPM